MIRHLSLSVAALVVATCGCTAQGTVVVGDKPVTAVCTGPEPSDLVALAAEQLQTYLHKISGATLEISEDVPEGEGAILLGAEAVKWAAAGIDLSDLGPEGCLLKSLPDGRFVAAGRTDRGTLNAAYDLLHLLGCRWFLPSEAGEYVPRMDTVKLPATDRRFEPSFGHRRIWAAANRLPAQQREEYLAWQRRNHMPGALTGSMGHAYYRIVSPRDEQLFEDHPEYFAEVDGQRTNKGQICTTNPDVIQRAVEYARKYFRDNPDNMMVSLSPNDGGGFCRCEACSAQGTISDNALIFANTVGEAIQEEFPGRYVSFYAYSGTSPSPTREGLEGRDNVIVWIATAFITAGNTLESLVEGWSAKVQHIGIRTYYSVCPWSWQMPRYHPEGLTEQLQYYHDNKSLGVSAESEDNFGSRGVNYWIAARLMYDLTQSTDQLLDDYYKKCWGAAAPAMRDYWGRWQGAQPVSGDRLALALRDLQRADEMAQTDEVRQRIAMMKTYLHYLRLYRDYGAAPRDQRTEALGRVISYGYSIQPFHMVMIPNVFYRVVGKPRSRKLDIPEETLKAWTSTQPIASDQIKADFAGDLADIQPLDVERVTFSEDLAPLEMEAEGAASKVAYRGGANECLVLAPEDGVIALGATTGLIRQHETVLTLETLDGKVVDEVEVPAGVVQTVPIDTGGEQPDNLPVQGEGQLTTLKAGGPGLFRLRIKTVGGSACRLDFGDLRQVAIATEQRPLAFIGGTAGPMYLYVPGGTEAFGVGLRTPDHHGRLTVTGPEGTVVLEEDGDYTLGEEFRIDVPEGQDGKIWSLTITKCEDCTLHVIGVPGYLSQKPTALLVPITPGNGQ